MAGAKAKTVTWLPVGGRCNVSCINCPEDGGEAVTPDDVRAAAERDRPAVLVLTGPGEPTMRRDLDALVHAARRGGASHVAVVTNGRAMSYHRVAAAVASLRPSHVIVTVHHPDARVHERTTRTPGSFTQTVEGLRNMRDAARRLDTRIVVRTVPQMALWGRLSDLHALARRFDAEALWIDGPREEDLEREARALAGRPPAVVWSIEELLARMPHRERSREGSVPARMHPDEGAVSLVVRTGCRNACTFCTTRIIQEGNRAAWPLDDLSIFHESLEEGRRKGFDSLRFVAVEPLEHPDIHLLVARARRLGYGRIEAWTSARALAGARWAGTLREAGLNAVDVPLLGATAEVHDAVAGVEGSFAETMAGLERARDLFEVTYHLVVTRHNVGEMGAVVEMARRMGLGDPASVLLPAPSSERPPLYEAFAARLTDVAAAAARSAPSVRAALLKRGLASQVPPCILERTGGIDASFVRALPRPPGDRVCEGDLDEPGAALKLRSPCPRRRVCGASPRCPGLHAMYLDVFGEGELEAL